MVKKLEIDHNEKGEIVSPSYVDIVSKINEIIEIISIKKSVKHVKGEETVIVEKENEICQGEINVIESHNYEISQLGNQLHSLASSKSCKYEIVKHNDLNIFGTQFHPEMSNDGQSIIQAFLSI